MTTKRKFSLMKLMVLLGCGLFILGWLVRLTLFLPIRAEAAQKPAHTAQIEIYTWESVGEISEVSKKTLSIRRNLRVSEGTWSLEPGTASGSSELEKGDQVLAKGKTQPDGSFETRRIYVVSPSASRQGGSGKTTQQVSDHGAPQSRVPTAITDPYGNRPESRGRGGYEGPASRIPAPPGTGSQRGPAGGLQAARASDLPRFLSGDAEGIVEQVDSHVILLIQSFFMEGDTVIRDTSGKVHKWKDLKPGQKIAVTVKDELDPKTGAIKATVIRLLP